MSETPTLHDGPTLTEPEPSPGDPGTRGEKRQASNDAPPRADGSRDRMSAGAPRDAEGRAPGSGGALSRWLKGLAPLALLAVLLVVFFRFGPLGVFQAAFPPVEELTIERIWFPTPGEMKVRVVNGGPEPVTIAQVAVDDAIWSHEMDGPRLLGRLESRTITIPYPWVEGDPHQVMLITSTGITFTGEVEVATTSPTPDRRYLGTFALIGIYVGVIPVLLGLLWLPFLRTVRQRWLDFFLAFTAGLLIFLGADALVESIETAARVPGAYQGGGLVLLGFLGSILLISAVSASRAAGTRGAVPSPARIALLIAIGVGLHNLGEGLAIGTAYSSGAISLGSFLVVGFLIHNTTEGLAIVAPLAGERPRISRLLGLGLLAGVPTIAGTWIGGFSYSPLAITLFLAIGAGAVAQVVLELFRFFRSRSERPATAPLNAAGILLGMLAMYLTGMLVAA